MPLNRTCACQISKSPFLVVLMLSLIFPVSMEVKTVFAQEANVRIKIGKCDCNDVCFTDEVTNVNCTSESIEFQSRGLPDKSHVLMKGIKATNQQYPREHAYEINLPLNNAIASNQTKTEPGPIGIAVNGVPLFDPGTQGPGSPHTLDEGELDECGGHAGRGDDYHYHIAPKCLIEELGADHVEQQKKPIGFANDGFPILALGWFKKANNIEQFLDDCRGTHDSNGDYFYNLKATSKWDIIDCYTGQVKRISRDRWKARRDKDGRDIVGAKASFHISNYRRLRFDVATCHIMDGDLVNQRVLSGSNSIKNISSQNGAIFYCNDRCYAEFFEPRPRQEYKGPILFYELITQSCPAGFNPKSLALFDPYSGPTLEKKKVKGGKKKKKKKKKKKDY